MNRATNVAVGSATWTVHDDGPAYVLLAYSKGERLVVPAGDSKRGALLRAAELHEKGDHFVMCIYSKLAKDIVAQQLTETELPGYVDGYRKALRREGGRPWRK